MLRCAFCSVYENMCKMLANLKLDSPISRIRAAWKSMVWRVWEQAILRTHRSGDIYLCACMDGCVSVRCTRKLGAWLTRREEQDQYLWIIPAAGVYIYICGPDQALSFSLCYIAGGWLCLCNTHVYMLGIHAQTFYHLPRNRGPQQPGYSGLNQKNPVSPKVHLIELLNSSEWWQKNYSKDYSTVNFHRMPYQKQETTYCTQLFLVSHLSLTKNRMGGILWYMAKQQRCVISFAP